MKPYYQGKKLVGNGSWKKDYHIHDKNHHKVENWWVDLNEWLTRTTLKQRTRREIEKELEDEKEE